jgi:lipopolysaccharide transport protein LptA
MRIFPYVFSLLFVLSQSAVALESDRNQSALIEADEFELDSANCKRIYRGNVSVRQGSIRILADEIEIFYHGEQLDYAVAKGNPAVFGQRPEGKDHDIIGTGQTIELGKVRNIVTFITDAQLRQDRDSIEGQCIGYDMARERMMPVPICSTVFRMPREDCSNFYPSPPRDRGLYVGDFKDGKFHGHGTFTWTNGDVYVGEWKDGAMHGQGTFTTANGDKYVGEWKDGQILTAISYDNYINPKTKSFERAYVGETGAPVFAGQSVTAASLGTLAAGTPVRLWRSGDGWAQISAPRGLKVWIYGKFVSSSAGVGVVTGSRVRLRSGPSTGAGSTVTGEASRGQKVWVIAVRGDWKQIEPSANFRAWIPSARIQPIEDLDHWEKAWRESAKKAADG